MHKFEKQGTKMQDMVRNIEKKCDAEKEGMLRMSLGCVWQDLQLKPELT